MNVRALLAQHRVRVGARWLCGLLALLIGPPMLISIHDTGSAGSDLICGLEPGPRAAAHRDIRSCSACHRSQRVVEDARCLACHDTIAARRRAQQGLHGHGLAKGQPCASCHREHRGDGTEFSGWPAVSEDGRLDHDITGYALAGAHLRVPCAKCHARSPRHFDPAPTQCGAAACHGRNDPHEGTRPHCESCHSPSGWKRDA